MTRASTAMKTRSGSFGPMDGPRAEGDFYRSPQDAIRMLLDPLGMRDVIGDDDYFDPIYMPRLVEPGELVIDAGAGDGRLTRPLIEAGYAVRGIELFDRGHDPELPIETGIDFLKLTELPGAAAVVMNPPFKLADRFVRHALALMPAVGEVHALLRHSWMTGKRRRDLMPALRRIVMCRRLKMLPGAGTVVDKGHGGQVDFTWFTFTKGRRGGGAELLHVEETMP